MGLAFASRAFWQPGVVMIALALALTCGACAPVVQRYEREQNIQGLIELLCGERTNEGVRTEVAQALGRIGAPTVEPLLAKLEQLYGGDTRSPPHEKVCQEAVEDALYRVGEPAVDRLIEVMASGDATGDWIGSDAEQVLVRIGEPAVEPLITLLADDVGAAGVLPAVMTLGKIGDPRAIEPFVDVVARCQKVAADREEQGLPVHHYVACTMVIEALRDIEDPRVSAMAPVARGQGVSATPFVPAAQGPHRLILLDPDGKATDWTYTLPREWRPDSPEETQLVCIVRMETVDP